MRLLERMTLATTLLLAVPASPALAQKDKPKPGGGHSVSYSIHALDAPADLFGGLAYRTYAVGINHPAAATDHHLVVGYAQTPDSSMTNAVCWTVDPSGDSALQLLDHLHFVGSDACGVNRHGEVVGAGGLDAISGASVPLYWPDLESEPIVLIGLPGEWSGAARAISDDRIIAGYSITPTGQRAVAWRIADGIPSDPLLLPSRGGSGSGGDFASAVGTTVGGFTEITGESRGGAVTWLVQATTGGGLTLAGTVEVLDTTGTASGINAAGALCGKDRNNNAVVWGPRSGIKRTKTTLNFNSQLFASPGRPLAINSGETIVGYAANKNLPPLFRAVVWASRSAPMQRLDAFLPVDSPFSSLTQASSVSDLGAIVGYGWQGANGFQAFLAIPD